MKRRTSTEAVGIWTAFALMPEEHRDIVRTELRKAHDFYNALVTLELSRRAMYRAARGAIGATLPALDDAMADVNKRIDAEVGALRARRGKTRKRVEDPVAAAKITALKAERKAITEQIKQARADVEAVYGAGDAEYALRTAEKAGGSTASRTRERTNVETLMEMLAEPQWSADWKLKARIDYEANEAKKALQAASGLTSGTYLLVYKAVEAAFKPAPKGQPKKPDPSPKDRFLGEGRLGVQVSRLSAAELLAGTNRKIGLRMSDRLPKGRNAQQRYGTLRMKVTRDGQYIELPVKLHRPLPASGVIVEAWIRAERQGPRTEYVFQCVVESPEWVKDGPVKNLGTLVIDTGWRLMEGGIRVAYWMDDHGRHGQILVPERVKRAVDCADTLRSTADTHFDVARAEVQAWMRANPAHVPPWMRQATATIAQWRAHGKLIRVARRLAGDHGLWKQWRADREAAGLDLFASFAETALWLQQKFGAVPPVVQIGVYLEWWRRKDLHLYDWETRERRYAEDARTEVFRKVAQVARQYEHVVIEEIDLPKFNRNAPPEEKVAQEWLHRQAKIASPGDFARRIMEACKGRATKLSASHNTQTCHKCAHVNTEWEHPEERVQTCAGCGASWDRDENACRVMLARWHAPPAGEQSGDAPAPAPARGAEIVPAASAEKREPDPLGAPKQVRNRDRSQSGLQASEMTAGSA